MPTPNYVAQAPTMLMIDETQQRLSALEQGREADRQRINTLEKQVEKLMALVNAGAPNAPLAVEDNPVAPKKGKG